MKTTTSALRAFPRFFLGAQTLALLTVSVAFATPDRGANCVQCHGAAQDGMTLTNFQATANLGAGTLKVFQGRPGQTTTIRLFVTNNWGGAYGLTINNLNNAGRTNAVPLSYTADAAWANRTTYFTVGPGSASPYLWTFNLAVKTNAVPDTYTLQAQMAGRDIDLTRWAQAESFYLQVLPNGAPRPLARNPRRSGASFTVDVTTASGFTYFLEYKTSISATSWTAAAQIAGDGTSKSITDAAAVDKQRLYRIRVQ